MKPGNVRRILLKRRNWLSVMLENAAPEKSRYFREEVEALDHVIALLPGGKGPTEVAESHRDRQIATARELAFRRRTECQCHRCPVHGEERKNASELTQGAPR